MEQLERVGAVGQRLAGRAPDSIVQDRRRGIKTPIFLPTEPIRAVTVFAGENVSSLWSSMQATRGISARRKGLLCKRKHKRRTISSCLHVQWHAQPFHHGICFGHVNTRNSFPTNNCDRRHCIGITYLSHGNTF